MTIVVQLKLLSEDKLGFKETKVEIEAFWFFFLGDFCPCKSCSTICELTPPPLPDTAFNSPSIYSPTTPEENLCPWCSLGMALAGEQLEHRMRQI